MMGDVLPSVQLQRLETRERILSFLCHGAGVTKRKGPLKVSRLMLDVKRKRKQESTGIQGWP